MSKKRERLPLCIYIIAEGPNGPCKIGITRNDRERFKALQTGNPRPLIPDTFLICRYAGELELRIHHRLRTRRAVGEWFYVTVEEANAALEAELANGCGPWPGMTSYAFEDPPQATEP